MPLDYNQRFDELLEDNPYAADYGIGPAAKPPSFVHLTEPLPPPRADPTRPSEAGRPSFLHLTEPLEAPEASPAEDYVDTPTYKGPVNQSDFGAGVNTATRRMTAGALNVTGGTLQGLARDPLGPIGWIPGLRGLADIAQPEQPIGWLQGAGQWAKDTAASPELAAPPGWAGGWTDTIASAVGSTIPFAATAAIPGGAAVSISSGAILGSYAALDEQVQEAIRNGATDEQIKKASRIASTGGLTEPVPLEIIFNRIPLPGLAKGAVQIAGRLLAKAAAEGGQEAVQTAIQNFAENYTYNPDQDLTEGMASAFGIGAIVGTGFAVPSELAAGKAAPAPATAPGAAAVPPPPGGAPAGTPGVTPPAAGVTTPAGTPPPTAPGVAPNVTTPVPGVTTPAPGVTIPAPPVMTAPAPVVGGEEDALLSSLEPMPEEEEEVLAPAPEGAPPAAAVAAPAVTPAPAEVAPEAPAEAPLTEEGVRRALRKEIGAPEISPFAPEPGVAAAPAIAPEGPTPLTQPAIAPRTPSQVQQATGVPAAEAARIAESEGWRTPEAPEAPAKTGFSHLTEPIGTRRVPTTGPAGLQAAGERVNLKATDAQRRVKNAEIGHYSWQGRGIGIEVPTGGVRRSTPLPGQGEPVEGQLPEGVAYGRFKRTRSRKAEVKVFVGPQPDTATHAYIIDQIDPTTGKYDEPKTFVGFTSLEEVQNAYISSYSDGRGAERMGSVSELPVAEFKKWLTSDRTARPYNRKATAAARRLRQAYTAEARQAAKAVPDEGQAAPPAGPTPDAGQPDAAQAGVAPEQGEVQGAGEEVQREAEPDVASWWDGLSIEHRKEIKRVAGVRRSLKLSWKALDKESQGKLRALHTAMSPETAGPISQPTEEEHAEAVRGHPRPPGEGHAAEGSEGPSRGDLQFRPEAQEQPSDRAPQREEERPAQQEGLAARWDRLPLDEKEAALAKAKVSRSPITSWKALGEANQQKLQAAAETTTDIQLEAKPGWDTIEALEAIPTASQEQLDELNAVINQVAGDVRVKFAAAFETVTGEQVGAQRWGAERVTPAGYTQRLFDAQGNVISREIGLAVEGRTATQLLSTAYHEAFHAIQEALGKVNAKVLKDALPGLRSAAAEVYGVKRAAKISDTELLAIGFGLWGAGRRQNIAVGLRRYYRAIKEFLRRVAVQAKLVTKGREDVFREIERGKYRNAAQRQNVIFDERGMFREPGTAAVPSGSDTQFALSLGRRPVRAPDPGATFVEPEETRLRRAERAWAYSAEGMAQLDKALADTGAAIPEPFKLARAELLYSSRAGERGEQLEKQRETPLLKELNLLQKTLGSSVDVFKEFDKYLIARHAPEGNARLRAMGSTIPNPTGMSDADAAAILASAPPEFAALAPHVYAIRDETLQMQLDSGLISQDVFNELKGRPEAADWVTLRGWADAEGDENIGAGRGYDLRSPEWHMRKGRTSMADLPLAYTLQNAYTAIARSEKNRVAQVLYWMARTFKNDKVWTVDRAKKEKYKYTDKKTGAVEIRERWMPPARVDVKNTIVVRVKGIPHYISIYNKPLLVAMRNMGAEETNGLLRGMATVLRTIGKLYTTYSPNFFIVNPIRDLQTAVLQMSEEERKGLVTGTMKKMPSSGKAMLQYLNGSARPPGPATTPLQYAHDFAMDGGKVSWLETKTIEDQKRRLRRAISPNRAQKLWDATRLGTVLETMENLNAAAENAIRLALYTELRQNHGYSRAEAAKVAKEITTNFNRKGTYGPVANSLYMFFNARVQGAVRTGRFVSRVARNPRKHPVAVGALAMLPAMGFIMDMWNYAMGGDDDEGLNRWDHAVPQYEKEKSFVLLLPGGGDKVYKFPLSFGYNAFFVLGQQLSAGLRNQMGLGEGTEPVTAAFNIAHALLNATSPVDIVRGGWAGIAPTLLAPAVEMGENKTYRGAPIYPTKYDPKSSDADLAFRSTPGVYREIAKRLESLTKYDKRKPALWDWSPESFQHLANTYLGGAGQFIIDQVAGNSWKILSGKASEIEVRDIPLARAVVGSTSNEFVRQNMYYEAWDQVDYLHRSMTEEGITSAEKKQLKQKYPVEAGVYRDFESAEKRLREQRAKRKKIDANERLSSAERQRRLDAVEKKMDDIRTETLGDYAEELKRQRTGATLH